MGKFCALLILLLAFSACQENANNVKILTTGIVAPILFSVDGLDGDNKTVDLGEHIETDGPRTITVKVSNFSKFDYTNLKLKFSTNAEAVPALNYVPQTNGELQYPGLGGSCSTALAPGHSCTIMVLFTPRENRRYEELLTLSFNNYVTPETHTAHVKLISGTPATLSFTSGVTQYTFGELVGVAKVPVVERGDLTVYEETLEIVNTGGLPAKRINVNLVEKCTSSVTNLCPDGMLGAYKVVNSCPAVIEPGERCTMKVSYQPKNQDPESGPTPEDIKEIIYISTLTLAYDRDPRGSAGALNGYFRSTSTNIQAIFKVAAPSVLFDVPIVSGNRDTRTFRVNNVGYREGELRELHVRDSASSLLAKCVASSDPLNYLECRHPITNAVLGLETLPYRFKDRDSCMSMPTETKQFINVNGGCLFDVVFQPSTTFITDRPTEFLDYQVEINYDSRYRGNETLLTKKLYNLSATSKAPARLVLERVILDGVEYPFTGTGPWVTDFGKLTLQSPSFYKYKTMIVTFKNIGSVEATSPVFTDGSNRSISLGGTGSTLGAHNPKYYSNFLANESTCEIIPAGGSCTIAGNFAPIGMTTTTQEDQNMFDGEVAGIKTKIFNVSYKNGSKFLDTNYEEDDDIPKQTVSAHLRGTLLRKALILNLPEDSRNLLSTGGQLLMSGDVTFRRLYVRNIGTGTAPYIRLMNPPSLAANSTNRSESIQVVPTPTYASEGADYDCYGLIDMDTTYTVPETATPDQRSGYSGLPKDKTCVLTVRMENTNAQKFRNPQSCNDSATTSNTVEELSRLFNRDLEAAGGAGLWEFCSSATSTFFNNINFHYYDGDLSDPSKPYGERYRLPLFQFSVNNAVSTRLVPYAPFPWMTATIYRPSFSIPTIRTGKNAMTRPAVWYYGSSNTFYTLRDDPAQTSQFIQADESRDHVPSLPGFSDSATHDYVLYLGALAQNAPALDFPVSIRNFGDGRARVTAINTTINGSFSSLTSPVAFPALVTNGSDLSPLTFRLLTTTPGQHKMTLNVTYETGRHLGDLYYRGSQSSPHNLASVPIETRTLRILVLAEVLPTGSHPALTMEVADYEVEQNNGAPPTITEGVPAVAPLTWDRQPPTTTLTYDTVKLTGTPTANDVFAQKKITIRNNTTVPANRLYIGYRPLPDSSAMKTVPTSFKTVSSTCTLQMTLAPGQSCELIIRYQPGSGDTTDNFVMSLIYSHGTSRFLMQNASVILFPKAPGNLVASGLNLESINYKVSPTSSSVTRSSYPLSFGTVNLDVVPKQMIYSGTSGTFKKLQMLNNQTTKASLLLSYHKYLAANSLRGYSPTSPPPNTTIPLASEYRNFAGEDYATVYVIHYTDGTVRVKFEASKGCLFGDDENDASIASFKKGFNTSTIKPCFIITTLNLNFDYLLKTVSIGNGDDMRENAAELWYYSVNRSSTASFFIHLKGAVNPDLSNISGTYTGHTASDTRRASFNVPVLTPQNSSVGNLVGVRILTSTTESTLNSPYDKGITNYVDIRPAPSASELATFTTGLLNGSYHYFRIVAIRRDGRFDFSNRFLGLNANEYLSASTNLAGNTKLVVPPMNYHYFHNEKLLVEKNLTGGVAYDTYSVASNRCTGRSSVVIKSPSNVPLGHTLINKSTWNLLLSTPSATAYANMAQVPHWMSDPTVNVTSVCSGLPGFIANQTSQDLTAAGVFYVRNSANLNMPVNQAVGGVPGTTYSNYSSFIDGAVGFASSRCMIRLP